LTTSTDAAARSAELAAVRSYLVFAAHHRQLVTLEQIATWTGAAKSRLAKRVEEVNRGEHAAGRPLLGAIVTDTEGPSGAFLRIVRELRGASDDDRTMWQGERDRVWAFSWSED
jgi:hypothetical protein